MIAFNVTQLLLSIIKTDEHRESIQRILLNELQRISKQKSKSRR